MEDKELFNFFRTRSASFDEMPSDELWNKIQNAIDIPKKASTVTISKIALLTTLSLITATAIVFFINKNKNPIIHNEPIHPTKIETRPATDSLIINTLPKSNALLDSTQIFDDTLKKKKGRIKNSTVHLKSGTFSIKTPIILPLERDSIEIIDSKILLDTMFIKPKVKGDRLLFETKEVLSKSEFDAFVKKILKQTKMDFGNLIVIKAKGHKPFRHLVKPIDTINIPHKQIKNPLIKPDSIYFDIKK